MTSTSSTTTSPISSSTGLDSARHELGELVGDMGTAARRARSADGDAIAMRRVAASLESAAEPLITVLNPIGALHHPATWEGRAADASRMRLDRFDEQTTAAIRAVDHLIAELRAAATRCETVADSYWGDYDVLSRQAGDLRDLLGIGGGGQVY